MSYTELLEAAKGGSAEAKVKLAECYRYGRGVEFSFEHAFEYAKEAWEDGSTAAADILFYSYFFGFGTEQNVSIAKDIAERAAAQGEEYSASLGIYYVTGIDCDVDTARALEYFTAAAARGSEMALQELAKMYLFGYRVRTDYEKAFEYIAKLYEIDSPYAWAYDGYMHTYGLGTERDEAHGLALSQKALDSGIVRAYVDVAWAKFFGVGTDKDIEGAKALLQEAEHRGSANAAVRLYNLDRYDTIKPDAYSTSKTEFNKRKSIYHWASCADPSCEYIVGSWTADGEERRELWLRAVRHGSPQALLKMVDYYKTKLSDRDAVVALCDVGIKLCVSEAYSRQAYNYALWNKPKELEYYRLGAEFGDADCEYNYALYLLKCNPKYWDEKAKNEPTPLDKISPADLNAAAKLLLDAISKRNHDAANTMLTVYDYLPPEQKVAASKILYDYDIRIFNKSYYEVEGDFCYRKSFETGERQLQKYIGKDKHVEIPEGVVEILENAFSPHAPVEEIVCPKSLRMIGMKAFLGMRYLRSVKLQRGVRDIQPNAFEDCCSLEEINIPSTVKQIWQNAFSGCKSLKQIVIPNGVEGLYYGAFLGCTSLEKVSLPDSLNDVDGDVFLDCPNLKLNEYGGVLYAASESNPYLWACRIKTPGSKLAYHPDVKFITTFASIEEEENCYDSVSEIEIPSTVSYIASCCLDYRNVKKLSLPPMKKVKRWFICGHYSEIIFAEGTAEFAFEAISYVGDGKCDIWLPSTAKKFEKGCIKGRNITLHAPEGVKIPKTAYASQAAQKATNTVVFYTPGSITPGATTAAETATEQPRPKVLLLDDGTAITSDGKTLGKNGEVIDGGSGTPKSSGSAAGAKSGSASGTSSQSNPFGNLNLDFGAYAPKPEGASTGKATASNKGTSGTGTASSGKGSRSASGSPSKSAGSTAAAPKTKTAPKPTTTPKPKVQEQPPIVSEPPAPPEFEIKSGVLVRYVGNGGYVEIPKNVREIADYAFDGRFDVTVVNIPEGVKTISGHAFSGCTGIYYLRLPRSLVSIGHEAFLGCKNARFEVYKKTAYNKSAFRGCRLFAVKKYK